MTLQPIRRLYCLILTNEEAVSGHWLLQECMDEMHMLGYIVKSSAAEMEVRIME